MRVPSYIGFTKRKRRKCGDRLGDTLIRPREGYAHVVNKEAMETDLLEAQILVGLSHLFLVVCTKRQGGVPTAHTPFPVVCPCSCHVAGVDHKLLC